LVKKASVRTANSSRAGGWTDKVRVVVERTAEDSEDDEHGVFGLTTSSSVLTTWRVLLTQASPLIASFFLDGKLCPNLVQPRFECNGCM
jgi:hypothetical protein